MATDEQDATSSFDTALKVAPQFGMPPSEALAIGSDVGAVVSTWKDAAKKQGLSVPQIERMASAFEHRDLQLALPGRKNIWSEKADKRAVAGRTGKAAAGNGPRKTLKPPQASRRKQASGE
jgi:serine/threonine-protein kinase HipA